MTSASRAAASRSTGILLAPLITSVGNLSEAARPCRRQNGRVSSDVHPAEALHRLARSEVVELE